jgi:CheY-like chemotaxis protein
LSTVLVVDDDAPTRVMLRMVLERAGHEVVEAAHGAAALDIIGPEFLPDVVMTDLTMPILSGGELINRLRSAPRTASIPIVVVSGNYDSARTLRASGLVQAVIDKPFDAADLTGCIRAVAGTGIRSRQTAPSENLGRHTCLAP